MSRILFDADKAAANLAKHGVSFEDAEGVLFDRFARTMEDTDAQGERRYLSMGLGRSAQLLVVVYSLRNGGVRLISARPATRKERKDYEA